MTTVYQPFHDSDGLTVHNGDVVDMLAHLEPASIDAVVTSPPYAMQRSTTYGGVPEKDYSDWTVAWMDALKPALKDDGSVIINISPHVKNGELSDYVLRTRLALRGAGWAELGELVWHKTDAMPTGVPSRPRRSWESLLWYGKHGRAWANPLANGKPTMGPIRVQSTGQHSRRADWGHFTKTAPKDVTVSRQTDVLPLPVSKETTGHPATYPWQLAEWCAKLICPPGGTVLDPFAGSGSTAVAALRNGFQSVAIEREPEYAQMIVDRYNTELAKRDEGLFSVAATVVYAPIKEYK